MIFFKYLVKGSMNDEGIIEDTALILIFCYKDRANPFHVDIESAPINLGKFSIILTV